ncbi:MAG: RidA family protein [bacterium]
MSREYFKGTWQENRSFSPAVVTTGGRQIWLAGVGMWQDEDGNNLDGDFEAQVHATFRQIERNLAMAGGKLSDIVTMTVFIKDVRNGDKLTELRKQYFPNGFPGSALITVSGFARPEMMVEIQAVAVSND